MASGNAKDANKWLRGPCVGDDALQAKLRQLALVKKRMIKSLEEGAVGPAAPPKPRPNATALLETQAFDDGVATQPVGTPTTRSPKGSPPKPNAAAADDDASLNSESALNIRNLRRNWETPKARHKEQVAKEAQRVRMARPPVRAVPAAVARRGGDLPNASAMAKASTGTYKASVAGGARGKPFVLCADEETARFTSTMARTHGDQVRGGREDAGGVARCLSRSERMCHPSRPPRCAWQFPLQISDAMDALPPEDRAVPALPDPSTVRFSRRSNLIHGAARRSTLH